MVEGRPVVRGLFLFISVQMGQLLELANVVLVDFDVLGYAIVPSPQLLDIFRMLLVLTQISMIIRCSIHRLLLKDVGQLRALHRNHLQVVVH